MSPTRPQPLLLPFCALAFWSSLIYLLNYAIPMTLHRQAVASEPEQAAAVGEGLATALPWRALLTTFLEATVPTLVAGATSSASRRKMLRDMLRVAAGLSGVALAVAVGGWILLAGQVRLVMVCVAVSIVPQLFSGCLVGYLIGCKRGAWGAVTQFANSTVMVATLGGLLWSGWSPLSAVCWSMVAGPFAALTAAVFSVVFAKTSPQPESANEPSPRVIVPGVFSSVQGGLNMLMVYLLHKFVGVSQGEAAVAGLSSCYGIYGVVFFPFLGVIQAATVFVSEAVSARNPRRVLAVLRLAAALATFSLVVVLVVCWVWREMLFALAGGTNATVAEHLPTIGLVLAIFLPIDVLINLNAYSVGRGFRSFLMPLVSTAIGLVAFLLVLGFGGSGQVYAAFLVGQATWSVSATIGAWRLYARFATECAASNAAVEVRHPTTRDPATTSDTTTRA